MTKEQFLSHPANFIEDGEYYLVSCPICKSENYAMAVSSGICVWCGEGVDGLLVERSRTHDDLPWRKEKRNNV